VGHLIAIFNYFPRMADGFGLPLTQAARGGRDGNPAAAGDVSPGCAGQAGSRLGLGLGLEPAERPIPGPPSSCEAARSLA
jgi:hypothetical protein